MSPLGGHGVYFGRTSDGEIAGLRQGSEGHLAVIGGSGSGKSCGIAMPTLRTWRGPVVVTDIKGEMYVSAIRGAVEAIMSGEVPRRMRVFDPKDPACPPYDVFALVKLDGPDHVERHIKDIVFALHPPHYGNSDPFWQETERIIIEAALIHYYLKGMDFISAVCTICMKTVDELCRELSMSPYTNVRVIIGLTEVMKPEVIASIDRGIRNTLEPFVNDTFVRNALDTTREDVTHFSWDDLSDFDLYLRVPEECVEQWGPLVRLMYTQLINTLQRRPEMYSPEGEGMEPVLLMMDEFPRFGKLESIIPALTTLRSKKVNIMLFLQSLAQLDELYGVNGRRIILDNCRYKLILRADDPDTQREIAKMVGTQIYPAYSVSQQYDTLWKKRGYTIEASENRDYTVQPHTLSALKDVLLLSPFGFFRLEKYYSGEGEALSPGLDARRAMFPISQEKMEILLGFISSLQKKEGKADEESR